MSYKIGIPRALMFHYYYPSWEVFFQEMGMEVVLSPETNKRILDEGVKRAVDDLCLPFKVYYGHVLELLDRVNYLFVPRLISLGKGNAVCPKFMGLPDMVRATFKQVPPLIEPVVDLRKGLFPLRRIAHQIGEKLKVNYWRVEKAYWKALKKQREFAEIQQRGFTPVEAMRILKNGSVESQAGRDNGLRVAVLGHSYITNDKYLSMDIVGHLRKMGVKVVTLEMFRPGLLEKAAERQPKKLFWLYNREVMGAAYHLLFESKERVQGIIQITAFGCGPDSLVNELVSINSKKHQDISLLNINIDEHSGQAGLITRLEAFIDLLERRKMA